MPSSAVRTFTDIDDYAAAMQRGTVELTVSRRGELNAKHARVDLHRLWMQRYSDNLPRVLDATNITTGRTYITFRTKPGQSLIQAGLELHPSAIYGYTDNLPVGSSLQRAGIANNIDLSSKRADAVVAHFRSQGVNANILSAVASNEYPPMQAPASFNLEAVKAKIQEMLHSHEGQ